MLIRRRESLSLLVVGGSCTIATMGQAQAQVHPLLLRIEKDSARVYILGFGEAKDRAWLTPTIQKAFADSPEIWFETPQRDPSAPPPQPPTTPPAQPSSTTEHNLFDVLSPALSARMLAAAQKYGVPREKLEHTRPWQAFFVLNRGYLGRKGAGPAELANFPDMVLAQMAYQAKKTVHSEFATNDETMAHFVDMPDAEAIERLEFLLDFLDDDEAGRLSDRYDWISGKTNNRAIDRMRTKWPALYQDEQVSRNIGWAKRIAGFLAGGGTTFVVIGLQHMLGPDSLPNKLREIGLTPQAL